MTTVALAVNPSNNICTKCGKGKAQKCGYGERTNNSNAADFDCTHPNAKNLECPCKYTWCVKCKRHYRVK